MANIPEELPSQNKEIFPMAKFFKYLPSMRRKKDFNGKSFQIFAIRANKLYFQWQIVSKKCHLCKDASNPMAIAVPSSERNCKIDGKRAEIRCN
ncbi:MAG: hypothetical protein KBT01_05070 [Clostridiales bacterium]|nr:hypothetical protein [Candidatus Blautia equi]